MITAVNYIGGTLLLLTWEGSLHQVFMHSKSYALTFTHSVYTVTQTHTVKQSLRALCAWQAPSFSSKCDHEVLFHFCPFANAMPDNLQKGADHNSHTQIRSLTVLSLSPHTLAGILQGSR